MRFKHVIISLMEALEGQKAERANTIKSRLRKKWKPLNGASDIDKFIELVAKADPSPYGIYMPWLAHLIFNDDNTNKIEDLERTKGDLELFSKIKHRLPVKDIYQYKSFNDLFLAIEPFVKRVQQEEKDKEEDNAELAALKGQIKIVYRGPEGWVMIPLTKQASCYLGQNTRWCTAGTISSNMFDNYDTSDFLIVIYNKQQKSRRQLHLTSGQYMNENDSPVPMSDIPDWARNAIGKFYKKYSNVLSYEQAEAAQKFTGINFTADTKFSAIHDMMSQYGITKS